MPSRTVLDEHEIKRAVTRIAHEIVEHNKGTADLVLLGIPTRGVPLARRLAEQIARIESGVDPEELIGSLDITMYRDDLRSSVRRTPGPTAIPRTGIDDRTVVLVDDVLFTGRSIRAAFDALADLGRPRAVRLAVLVDRGHRQFPIRADHVGKNLPTASSERVDVRLSEVDDADAVLISKDGEDA